MSGRAGTAAALVAMTRPTQLLLVEVVAVLGIALARARGADVDPAVVVAGLAALLPVAASIHLANEYADHETDLRTVRTPFSGGSGALPRSGLDRSIALRAAQLTAAIGLGGALAAWGAGMLPGTALALLVAGLAGGWAYSVGPLPLAWHGLGEVANGVLGGMLLPLYGVAIAGGAVDVAAVVSFLPLTLIVTANLLATTWPDRAADASVGKRTLATRWPVPGLRLLYAVIAGTAVAVPLALLPKVVPPIVVVAALTVLPLLAWGLVRYTRQESPLPTVAAMGWLVAVQLVAWVAVG